MRIASFLAGFVLLAATATVSAQDYSYHAYVDTDANPGTGCDVVYPGGTVTGAERRLTAEVTGTTVAAVTLSECASGSFAAPSNVGGGYPVGLNIGLSGSDVIEFTASRAQLDATRTASVRLQAVGTSAGGSSDVLLTTTGVPGGPIILLGLPFAIPVLGGLGLALMALALLWVGAKRARRVGLAGLGALLFAGSVWAANFVMDGAIGDWSGVSPRALDAAGDASPPDDGADVLQFFAEEENGNIYFRIDAADIENQRPVAANQAQTYLEDAAAQTITLTATDGDGDPLTFAIVTPPNKGVLSAVTPINATSASVSYLPNANANGADSFTFSANDGQSTSLPATVSITLTPVNDVPSFTAGANVTVLKDTGAQTINPWATAISAGPADESAQTLAFTITANDNAALFSVQPAVSPSGVLTFTGASNANGTANLSVRVQDSGGTANGGVDTSAVQNFTITMTAVNDAPSFTAGPNQTVLEDAGAQTVAPWATGILAGPPDEVGQTLTFNITNNTNAALFSAGPAVSATGQLTYTPAANANGTATITLNLQDNGGTANGGIDTSATQTFTITVTAVNDVPSFTAGANVTVLKDTGAQTINPWATAISAGPADESAQTLAFTITANDNAALFSVQPAVSPTGVLTFTGASNANGTANLSVRVQDSGGTANGGVDTSAVQNFTITMTAVNDAPSFTAGPNQTVLEDAGAQTVAPWATGILAGPPDEVGQTLTFNITNNTNAALFSAGPAVSATGQLTYTPAANANGTATITLNLQDNGGTANGGIDTSAPQTFTITVTAVNDVPSFTAQNPPAVNEDAAAQTAPVATAISAGPADESAQTLTFTITNNSNAALFTGTPTISPAGVLSYTPAANTSGSAILTFRLQDNGGTANGGVDTSATQTATVTVNSVNDVPSFTAGPNQTVLEDAVAQTVNPWATGLSAGPPDESAQTLSFNITNNTNAALFSAGPAVSSTGVLTYTPAANTNGTATITLNIQDNGGTANGGIDTSATQTFIITVTAVNDVPSFTAQNAPAVGEDSGPQTATVATAISAGPADESAQTLTFTITNNSNAALFNGTPTISPLGVLSYTPAANTTGTATLTFRLQDNGGTANGGVDTSATQTATVTVNAVNDAPSFTAGPNQSVAEDAGPQTANPWATGLSAGPPDEAGQTLMFNITGNTNGALFSAGPAVSPAGVLTYTPAANANGVATITLNIQDNGGTAGGGIDTSATQTFTITVTAFNDAPVNTVPGAQSVGTGATLAFNTGNGNAISITDIDAGAGNLTTTISTTIGTLSATSTNGAVVTGSGTASVAITDVLADVNATLQTVTFTSAVGGVGTINVLTSDLGNTGAGGAQTDSDNIAISVDSPPTVTATTPSAGVVANNLALNVTFSENITTIIGPAVTLTCGGPNLITGGATGTNVGSLTPTYAGTLPSGACTLTVVAANVTDTDLIDPPNNMVADFVVNFTVDAAPTVSTIAPANGATNQSNTAPIVITFSESVAATVSAFTVECPVGSPIAFSTSASPATVYTLSPTTSWPAGQTCTVTVVAAQISDSDLADPPQNMAVNFTSTFATDAAPTVTGGTPLTGATNVATTTTVTYTFSENVDAGPGAAITLDCGGPITGVVSGTGTSTLTFTPGAALPVGTLCTATAVAANIGDSDTNDPPNNLAADSVRTFTTDAPPSVLTTVPVNGATDVAGSSTITINFSESVNFSTVANAANTSFDLECPLGSPANFTVSTASPATTVVLDPLDSAISGQTCTISVRAVGITDADAGDPPDNMAADFIFSVTFAGVANDDAYAVNRHLTLTAPGAAEVDANDILGASVITGFGTTIGTANGTAPGATIDDGANGTMTLNANGTFTFFPPINPVGATTDFFYTITGGDTASITFTYQDEQVWFVDDNAVGTTCTGDNTGAQACPATTIGAVAAVDTANDTIFVFPGNQTGTTVTLEAGERLIGDGASGALATHSGVTPVLGSSFAAFGGTPPVISCAGACITLGTGNFLRGVTIGDSGGTGTDLVGTNFGTLTVNEVTLNGTGRALNLATGTIAGAGFNSVTSTSSNLQGINLAGIAGTLTIGSTTISGNTTQGILVGTTTGNVAFGNTSVNGGTDGISLQNNSAGTRTFGTLTVSGNSAAGFLHGAGGGVTTVTGATTITNPGGIGVDIQNSTSAITFAALTVNKGASNGTGINIATSGTGSLTATSLAITTNNGAGLVANTAGTLTIGGATNTIASTGGVALDLTSTTLGGGATFSTVSSTGSGGKGINLDTVTGALTMNGGAIATPTGIAFDLNAGASNVTYAGTITSTAANRLIEVTARTAGTTLFSGNLSGTGGTHTGINIANNTGGTVNLTGTTKTLNTGANAAVTLATNTGSNINFTGGGLAITTTSGAGFNATGGATGISVTGTVNTIASTTGTPLNVSASTIAAAGLTFQSIAANGAANGIVLNATGANAGLTVTGTGAAGTGGTIQNISNRGASFINAIAINLDSMTINNTASAVGAPCGSAAVAGANTGCNAAIHLDTVSNVTLDAMSMTTSGQQGINGIGVTGFTLTNSTLSAMGNAPDEDGLHFHNMLGTNTITNVAITGSGDDNVNIQNLSSTASTININNGSYNAGVQGSGILFGIRNTANTNINIAGPTIDNNFSGGIVADTFDTATSKIDITGVAITNNNDGIQISSHNGSTQFDIHDNIAGAAGISNNDFVGITILKSAFSTTGTLEGQITNTELSIPNDRPADGIFVFAAGGAATKVNITNNTIAYRGTQRAIMIQGGQDGAAIMDTTITGNNIDLQLDGTTDPNSGIQTNLIVATPVGGCGVGNGCGSTMCSDIGGAGALSNVFTRSLGGGALFGGDIRARQRNTGPHRLPGYAGAGGDTAAVQAYLAARNTGEFSTTASTTDSLFSGGAACAAPIIP